MNRNDSVRQTCLKCVYKHLASSIVLGGEYLSQDNDGDRPYKDHLLYVTGNLQQAEEQVQREYPLTAQAIRSLRVRLETNKWEGLPPSLHVPTEEDIEEILKTAGLGMDGLPLEDPFVEVMEPEEVEDPLDDGETEESYMIFAPMDDRFPKAEANYQLAGSPNACQDCDNWMGLNAGSNVTGGCSVVEGTIFKQGHCDLFTKKK